MKTTRRGGPPGFTLVELLVVVTIIGIVAAIAIPNLLDALRRAKQSRTMQDMRTIAQAVQTYATDTSAFLATARTSSATIAPFLRPTYVEVIPATDGWSYPIQYEASISHYTVISYGANREPDTPYSLGTTTQSWQDIVLVDGTFLQWPEGAQID